jgi:hypothetical protein
MSTKSSLSIEQNVPVSSPMQLTLAHGPTSRAAKGKMVHDTLAFKLRIHRCHHASKQMCQTGMMPCVVESTESCVNHTPVGIRTNRSQLPHCSAGDHYLEAGS